MAELSIEQKINRILIYDEIRIGNVLIRRWQNNKYYITDFKQGYVFANTLKQCVALVKEAISKPKTLNWTYELAAPKDCAHRGEFNWCVKCRNFKTNRSDGKCEVCREMDI